MAKYKYHICMKNGKSFQSSIYDDKSLCVKDCRCYASSVGLHNIKSVFTISIFDNGKIHYYPLSIKKYSCRG